MDQLLDELRRAASDMDDAARAVDCFKEGEALSQFLAVRAARLRATADRLAKPQMNDLPRVAA